MDTHEAQAGLSRRHFLATAATTAAAVGGSGALAAAANAKHRDHDHGHGHGGDRIPRDHISIQLYTVRDQLAADFQGTLNTLGRIGYKRVEHAGFVGRTAAQFKAALDQAGLRASSGHQGIPQPFNEAAWQASLNDAKTLRSTYIVVPFFGIDFGTGQVVRDRATWAAFARDLNRAGAMARREGLKLGYHNHNWEFFRLTDDPSKTAFDVLVEETDRRLVHFELDLFWAVRGARDPVDIVERLGDRVLQYHCKDLKQDGLFEDLGVGLIDFPRIFAAHRVDEYIVERDDAGTPPRTPPQSLDTARVGFEYLANVRIPRGRGHH